MAVAERQHEERWEAGRLRSKAVRSRLMIKAKKG